MRARDPRLKLLCSAPRRLGAAALLTLGLAMLGLGLKARPVVAAETPLPPLPAGPGFERLPVPGYLSAVLAWPMNTPARALPILVATHGSFDQPEWNCETYQQVVRGAAVVLCPRGRLRWDSPAEPVQLRFFFPSTGDALGREVDAAVAALKVAAASRLAPGPVVYAGFSQGAILGAPYVIAHPARFPRVLLVEGGHGAWNPGSARAFQKGGGQRVLFACGRASCLNSARIAAAHLTRAGVPVRVVYAPDQGHTYDAGVKDQVTAAFAWLVEGDPRFPAAE